MATAPNNAQFILSAVDESAGAFASVQKNLGGLKTAAVSVLGALGAVGTVAGFTEMIRGSIDVADHLNDLSKSTMISVEDLAGLKLLAKQSGTELDGLAKGINRMSVEMGKSPEKFQALGITAKDNTEAFKQFADIFNQLPDIQQRNALANAVFGKSWAEMAPILSEGGKKIGETIDKGKRLSGSTKEMSAASDEFNDKWAELTTTGGLLNRQVASLLPILNSLADDFLDVQKGANDADTAFHPLAETFRAATIFAGNVAFTLRGVGIEIGVLAAQANALGLNFTDMLNPAAAAGKALAVGAEGWRKFNEIGAEARADAENNRAAFDAWEKKILDVGTATTKTAAILQGEDRRMAGAAAAQADAAQKAAAARAKAFLDAEKDAAAAATELKRYEGAVKSLSDKLGNLLGQSESEKLAFELYGKSVTMADGTVVHLTGSLEKLSPEHKKVLPILTAEIDARKNIQEVLKAEIAYRTALDAVMNSSQAITNAAILTGRDQIEQYKFETDLIGKTADQLTLLNAQRKIDLDYKQQLKKLGDVYTEGGVGLDAAILKLDAATQALRDGLIPAMEKRIQLDRDWATGSQAAYSEYVDNSTNAAKQAHDAWTNAFNGMQDMLTNFFMTGKLNFKSFITLIEEQLARLASQQFVVNIVGNVTRGMAASGSGMVSSASGSAIGSMAGSMFGAGGMGGAFSAGAGWMTGASTLSGSITAATSLMSTAGGMMSGLTMMAGAALPFIGVALAVASMLGSKGGPKDEAGYSPNGLNIQGRDIGGTLQGSQRGDVAGAKTYSDTISAAYNTLATSLNLAQKTLDVGIFYAKDPKGTSQTQLQVTSSAGYDRGARLGGIENVGRSDAELQAAINDETSRVLLDALEKSDLTQKYKDILDAVGADAGADKIQAAIKRVTDAKTQQAQLEDQLFQLTASDGDKLARTRDQELAAVDPLNVALQQQVFAQQDLQKATAAATAAAQAQAANLKTYQSNFYSADQQKQIAAQHILDQINAVTIERGEVYHIGDVLNANRDTFRQVADSIDQSTDYGQRLYATMLQVSGEFAAITDPIQQATTATNNFVDTTSGYTSALNDQATAAANARDAMLASGKGISEYIQQLSANRLGTASPEALLAANRLTYLSDLTAAKSGNLDANNRITNSAQAYLDAQKGYTASGSTTQAVISQVISELKSLPTTQSYESQTAQHTATTVDVLQQVAALLQQHLLLAAAVAQQSIAVQQDIAASLSDNSTAVLLATTKATPR